WSQKRNFVIIQFLSRRVNPGYSFKDLNAITDSRLKVVKIDVTCDQSIKDAFAQVEKIVGDSGLNLLLNNAGILPSYFTTGAISRETLMKCMNVNAFGPAIVSQTFLPLLKKASAHQSGDHWGVDRAAIVNISSFWASVSQNQDGSGKLGSLAYKMSKSALNQLGKTMAIDLANDKILVAQFCPGWVKTDMGNMGGIIAAITMVYPASVFITGANRGIGLGLVREFLKVSSVKNVIAGARNPDNAKVRISSM
ncbi:hypothetical protein ANCDUO_15592, partial [Ancylostoma duodenale]